VAPAAMLHDIPVVGQLSAGRVQHTLAGPSPCNVSAPPTMADKKFSG